MAQFVMIQACIVFLGQGKSGGVWEVIPGASCIEMVAGLQGLAGQAFASCSPSQRRSRDRAAGEWPREAPAQESGMSLGQGRGLDGILAGGQLN